MRHQKDLPRRTFVKKMTSTSSAVLIGSWLSSCVGVKNRNPFAPVLSKTGMEEVQIGDQIWMAKHFDGVTFRNGDPIPLATSKDAWEMAGKAAQPAWCHYENNASIGAKYGRIYNWYAISDPRGFCPQGWHVPTNDEWKTLENYLGSSVVGLRLKCDDQKSKFCALLGGYRGKEGGFSGMDEFTYLASSTERDPKENDIWGRGIHTAESTIMHCGLYKEHGLYVRLIKD